MITALLITALVATVSNPVAALPPELQPLVWVVVGVVLLFGVNAALTWLNKDRATQANPVIKAAEGQVIDLLQQVKDKLGPSGANAQQLAPLVQAALEAAYHSHTVATGEPHADDPRAP